MEKQLEEARNNPCICPQCGENSWKEGNTGDHPTCAKCGYVDPDKNIDNCEHLFEEDEEDDTEIIRAKWTMDGAKTLSEAAEKLRAFAKELEELEGEGWQLEQEVSDDYGFIRNLCAR
jgi:hypothetical protein